MDDNLNFSDFETYEDYEDYVKNKRTSAPKVSVAKLPTAKINIKIVNATGAAQIVELFNPNASVALVKNLSISSLNPFTAADVADALVNGFPVNHIMFDVNGNLIYNIAGGLLTVSCTNNGVSYRQLFESCKTMRFRINQINYSFIADPQADNGINFFYRSTFGKTANNEITPSVFKDPINPQTKLLKVAADFKIDCESGISQLINIGETVGMSMDIDNIERGLVWSK